jgi:YidC/Oxa1 family membrane protein insertase
MKNSNLIIAVLLSVGFVFFWDAVVVKRFTPKPGPAPMASPVATSPSQSKAVATTGTAAATIHNTTVSEVTLHTNDVEAVFETQGARALRWKIKEEDGNWVELIPQKKTNPGHPLETYPELNFSVSSKTDQSVTFVADHPSGFRLTKTFTLLSEPPYHSLSLTFLNLTGATQTVHTALGWNGGLERHAANDVPDARMAAQTMAEMRVVGYSGRAQSWHPGLIMNRTYDTDFQGPYTWIGVDNHHFLAALIPAGTVFPMVHITADRKAPPHFEVPLEIALAPHASQTQLIQMYVGPKKYGYLKTLKNDLQAAVDFGVFGVIAKVLLRGLEFFKSVTHNYGWAIVLLTMTLQLVLFPLTRKSLQHSVRMKELQPQVKQLQEQLKNDPKRMQIEMMNLYRKNGMKFMGMEGCFPMLLQIPVFFAFYTTLRLAYELRGASWLWIPDLGVHDPIYALPILMGIGMFLQQRATTVAADPAQAKVMMFMPVIMTFMFLKLPAGLVLYWTVNSLCTIVIQKILQWRQHAALPTATA